MKHKDKFYLYVSTTNCISSDYFPKFLDTNYYSNLIVSNLRLSQNVSKLVILVKFEVIILVSIVRNPSFLRRLTWEMK